ncbi:AAA family ATPase [uncultured Sphaerochaeta sp.]|uniref:AAA family ATPase n=1 Tax=uncultured Sphaerochaeta sp. TaxID=886478 RepID=UPI002A0A7652|nr:AAA family ATPase [uncultured Sphaerochaeta sp.]
MKLLELRFKNLNSLYGEWVIDFTHPEYESNGIFALTGPTGAGKSTILDAICLALYGATPRLGRITKSNNEIMSRQTGSCYAEVLFASNAGRFRCHWEQRRARSKAEGNLQEAEHQIFDADSGKPIETMKSRVGLVIEEKTGMDFDRFTRSILLAQGSFDSFLKADSEQKSKILEQITGTEMYSEISKRVHERQRKEMDALKLLQAETSGIVILEPEQEKTIREELEEKLHQEKILTSDLFKTNEALLWMKNIENLNKEINDLTQEKEALNREMETFKPRRAILNNALKASSLEGTYATLTSLRKQQVDDQAALHKDKATLPKLESSANTHAEALKAAEQKTLKAKDNLKTATTLIQKIRSLDQRISEQAKAVSEGTEACTKESIKIEANKQALSKERAKRTTEVKTLGTVKLYLEDNARDAWLVSGLAGVEEQFGNLVAKQQELTQKEIAYKNANTAVTNTTNKLEEASKQYSLLKQQLESATKNLQQGKDDLDHLLGDKLLREYRTEKENLLHEMAYIRKIEKLKNERLKLEDGKPCPLCGSTEHPFAQGNIPVPDAIEKKIESLTNLIDKAEEQEEAIKNLAQAETFARNNLNVSEKYLDQVANDAKTAETTFTELKDALIKLHTNFDTLKLAVSVKLESLGITEIPETEVETLLGSLKSRLNTWQGQVRKNEEIQNQIAAIDSEIKRIEAVIETQGKNLTERQEQLRQQEQDLADITEKRKQLYANKDPDEEQALLDKAIADAEEAEKEARSKNTALQQELTTAKAYVDSLKKRIEQTAPKLKKAEDDFSTLLIPTGFPDEEAFLEARLSLEERESLSLLSKKLDDARTELTTRQKDRETRLAKEIAKMLTDKTFEELNRENRELQESLEALRDAIAGSKLKLSENTAAKERILDKQSAIEAQKKECHRWEMLHDLIGSADGKKYRTFAQGLTFELMVAHANRQLEKMTDRYLLIRDESQPLELNVVDNYQAGEIRSTKNLSGGESFIVSLTLALGLSQMASKKVRVDSLFLDEGFGSLDEETLETALEALSALQQDGKLIGIISHVPALKERISTQISITPLSGGRSTISGPGCTKQQAI